MRCSLRGISSRKISTNFVSASGNRTRARGQSVRSALDPSASTRATVTPSPTLFSPRLIQFWKAYVSKALKQLDAGLTHSPLSWPGIHRSSRQGTKSYRIFCQPLRLLKVSAVLPYLFQLMWYLNSFYFRQVPPSHSMSCHTGLQHTYAPSCLTMCLWRYSLCTAPHLVTSLHSAACQIIISDPPLLAPTVD